VKILIVNGYVRENKGDAALMSVLCSELARVFPGSEIVISSQEDIVACPTFEGRRNVGSFTDYVLGPGMGRPRRALRLLVTLCLWALSRGGRRLIGALSAALSETLRVKLQAVVGADLVVSMGGGYLNAAGGIDGTLSLYLMLLPMMIAEGLTTCVVTAPQSVGPFSNGLQRWMVRRTLNRVELLELREDISTGIVRDLAITAPVARYPDMGFVFGGGRAPDVRDILELPDDRLLVGVTVRQWLAPEAQARYERAMAATIDSLCARHGVVAVLIPQVTSSVGNDDDRIVNRRVYALLADRAQARMIDGDLDHQQIKAVYGGLDVLIGTRFHSVIFALTSYVPAIAVAYEHKTTGIMRDLGLEQWVVDIRDVDEESLVERAESLLREAGTYRCYLEDVLPAYVAKARQAGEMMAEAYLRSQA